MSMMEKFQNLDGKKLLRNVMLFLVVLLILAIPLMTLYRTKLELRALTLNGEPIRIGTSLEAGTELLYQINVKGISSESDPILSLETDRNIYLIPGSMFLEDRGRTWKQVDDSEIKEGVRLAGYSKDREIRIHVRAKVVNYDLKPVNKNLFVKATLQNGEKVMGSTSSIWALKKEMDEGNAGVAQVHLKEDLTNNEENFITRCYIRKAGEKGKNEEIAAKAGERVQLMIYYKNTSNELRKNITFKMTESKCLEYVKGSTEVYNSNHPKGKTVSDSLSIRGINVGDALPGGASWITAEYLVLPEAQKYRRIRSWAQVDDGTKVLQDCADVVMAE